MEPVSLQRSALVIRNFKTLTVPGKLKVKVPPMIVIPKKSDGLSLNSGTCISLLKNRVYSKTPHPHLSISIQRLVEKCSQFWDYNVIRAPDVFTISRASRAPDDGAVKKTEALEQILKVLSDPVHRKVCGFDSLLQLESFLEKQLFHPIPVLPPENDFDEKQVSYIVTNWVHLSLSYQIIEVLIRDVDLASTFVSAQLVKRLVDMFLSPVKEEHLAVERVLRVIMETYPGLRKTAIRLLYGKVMMCLEGEGVAGMASVLRLFTHYFENYVDRFTQSHMVMFKTAFFPLFATYRIAHFEKALSVLAALFCRRDAGMGVWCLNYLASHFPVQCNGKQLLFLKQIENLLPFFPRSAMASVSNQMAMFISKCLISPALSVLLPTLMMIDSPGFSGLIQSCSDSARRALMSGLKIASTHWKPEMAQLAQKILDNTPATDSVPTDDSNEKWELIRMAASSYVV